MKAAAAAAGVALRPLWVPDKQVSRCTSCARPFTLFRRRHHCRNCGHIFCNSCTPFRSDLSHLGYTRAQRTCTKCFQQVLRVRRPHARSEDSVATDTTSDTPTEHTNHTTTTNHNHHHNKSDSDGSTANGRPSLDGADLCADPVSYSRRDGLLYFDPRELQEPPQLVTDVVVEEEPEQSRVEQRVSVVCEAVLDTSGEGALRFEPTALHPFPVEVCAQFTRGAVTVYQAVLGPGRDPLYGSGNWKPRHVTPLGHPDLDPYFSLLLHEMQRGNVKVLWLAPSTQAAPQDRPSVLPKLTGVQEVASTKMAMNTVTSMSRATWTRLKSSQNAMHPAAANAGRKACVTTDVFVKREHQNSQAIIAICVQMAVYDRVLPLPLLAGVHWDRSPKAPSRPGKKSKRSRITSLLRMPAPQRRGNSARASAVPELAHRFFHASRQQLLATKLKATMMFAFHLKCLHAEGIIHSDVALRNLMTDGESVFQICDLGYALVAADKDKAREHGLPFVHKTMPVLQASPEMLETLRVSRASDCWQLGYAIDEIFSGRVSDVKSSSSFLLTDVHALLQAVVPSVQRRSLEEAHGQPIGSELDSFAEDPAEDDEDDDEDHKYDESDEEREVEEALAAERETPYTAFIHRLREGVHPPRPADDDADYPSAVYELVLRLLDPDPKTRATCDDVIAVAGSVLDEPELAALLQRCSSVSSLSFAVSHPRHARFRSLVPRWSLVSEPFVTGLVDGSVSELWLQRRINTGTAFEIGRALCANHRLQKLSLGTYGLRAEHVLAFCRGVQSQEQGTCALQALMLSENPIGDEGVGYLADLLATNHSVVELRLEYCQIGDAGASTLFAMLASSSSPLRTLRLSTNEIGDAAMSALASALAQNACALESLSLGANKIEASGAQVLAGALETNTTLRQLDLEYNCFGDQGAVTIASALAHNTTLRSLSLGANQIADDGAVALANALSVESGLENLSLGGNLIGDRGASLLGSALTQNTTLRTLSLGANRMTDAGVIALAEGLRSNDKLEKVSLNGRHIGAELMKRLEREFKERLYVSW